MNPEINLWENKFFFIETQRKMFLFSQTHLVTHRETRKQTRKKTRWVCTNPQTNPQANPLGLP